MERESLQRQVDKKMMHLKVRKKRGGIWMFGLGENLGKVKTLKLEKSKCVLCEAEYSKNSF